MSQKAACAALTLLLIGATSLVDAQTSSAQTAAPSASGTQASTTTRIRGDIESVDAHGIHLLSRRGEKFTLQLPDNTQIVAIVPIAIDAIKPGSFIGCAAIGQPDGTLRALEVHVFPESMRGSGEGHRPFDMGPNSTMTNGTVGDVVLSEGRTLKVNYKGGEKTIFVPPETPIVTYEPGSKAMLTPSAHVIVFANAGPGETLTATRISVGKNGLVPPM